MRLIRMLGVALLWVAGVAFVASVSWVAINSAGRQVVDGTMVSTTRSDRSLPAAAGQASTAETPSEAPSARPHPATSSVPAGRPDKVTSAQVSSNSPGSEATPTRTSDVESGRMLGTPRLSPVSNTLPTSGGVLWLQCTDRLVSDFLAQPGSGWSASAGARSTGELEVHFTRRDVSIQVVGTCPSGEPHFSVRTDDGEYDGEYDGEHDSDHADR